MLEVTQVDADLLRRWPLPDPGSDKEERGHVLVVGGGRATPGAVLLAAEAAFRVGCGKVTVGTVQSRAAALTVAVPELAVTELAEDDGGNIVPGRAAPALDLDEAGGALLVGPGLTDVDGAAALVAELAPAVRSPLVLDALATAYVTEDAERVASLSVPVVITVNTAELARCLHREEDDVEADPESHAAALARRTGATVLCGGACKVVASGDALWRVDAGNAGLGISGSGDVQAGLVAGLLGRGAPPDQAAVWAAHLHASAGDRLADRVGPVGYLARELPAQVPGILAATGS